MIKTILNTEIFWTALSAIATTTACIIALWQTKYNNRKKVKLKFNGGTIALFGSSNFRRYISIEIINTGNRKIMITEWCYFTNNKSERVFIPITKDNINKVQLPQEIDIENKLDLYFDFFLFIKSLDELVKNNKLKENQKITFGVRDSTGKFYKIKSQSSVKDFLKIANNES